MRSFSSPETPWRLCPNSNKMDATIKGRFEASFYCFSIQQTVTRKDSFPGIFPEQPIDWYSRRAGTFPAKTSIFSGRSVSCATYCTSVLSIPRLACAGLHIAMPVPHGNKRQNRIPALFKGQRKQNNQINVLDQPLRKKAETH